MVFENVTADKPPIEELQYFLEYQIPKQWSPVFDLPLGPPRKEPVCPSLQFSLMGPKLYVSTSQVSGSPSGQYFLLRGLDNLYGTSFFLSEATCVVECG